MKNHGSNPLYGKKIIFDGDSICWATSETVATQNRGWAYRVGAKNNMEWYNYGRDGATVTAEMYQKSGARHWVTRSIDAIHEKHTELDYLIFEGGTNDADLHSHIEERDLRGGFDPYDFSGDYDRTTFAGALESIFYRATRLWCGKRICYIVAHKMTWGACFINRRSYFDLAIEICKKWGIPYLDLWNGCYLNSSLPWMYDKEKSAEENEARGSMYIDSQHLSSRGYDLTADIIDSFLKTL